MKIVKSCGTTSQNTQRVATNGINAVVALGAPAEFFWTPFDVEIDSADLAEDKDTFDALVAAANGVYLGKNEVESTGTDREIFENNFFGLKVTTREATKTLQLSAPMCACTSSELEKMNGRAGRIFERTTLGYILGRVTDDGKIQGFPVSNMYKAINTVGTTDNPVSNTVFEIPYSDPRGDQKNPFQAPIPWNFSEIDQPYSVEAVISNFVDAGANITFDAALTKDCSAAVLTGAIKANLKISDANGADIDTFTVSEIGATGVYSFNVTTDESIVYLETNGITTIANDLYTMDEVKVNA